MSWTEQQLIEFTATSHSMREVTEKLGIKYSGSSYRHIKSKIVKLGLDISHWRHQRKIPAAKPLEEHLKENSSYSRSSLKKRLLKEGKLENKCYECELTAWRDKPIVLQLDHINGISNDNRLENLRMLCPNCHSQTPTYSGRGNTKFARACSDCGTKILNNSVRCKRCAAQYRAKLRRTKIQWPRPEEVLDLVLATNFVQAGKKLGVSDNAVRKFLKLNSLI